jgi:hypothetical protein
MGAALKLVDEAPNGTVLREMVLELATERVTAREIIERRVREEVRRFNAERGTTVFSGLVQPTDTEAVLNGYRLRQHRTIDAEQQCALACRAFESNGFFMLADDHQIESLDEEIVVAPDSKISFVKLVPLVGG